ncbi:MAG: sulfatase-like hydrolase/transferase, partial [Rhodoferax sp.]|nr:sulfatase-like hydrolase/transferase [Rhodoferax sp.]
MAADDFKTYPEGGAFTGHVARTAAQSQPAWPMGAKAPAGAPNVLVLLLDDVGFAQLGCYGSTIRTPNMDRLAAAGLRYRDFHTTAICSPTRACLLTGRNHHSNGVGIIQEMATGFPGYNGKVPKENGFLSEVLLAR